MSASKRRGTRASGPAELEVPGGRIAYEVGGRGAPIVFLHEGIADRRMWDREFVRYSARHAVVRFDQRGYGTSAPATGPFSYSRDVVALIDHLGLERPLLVGPSMGGATAIDVALDHPEKVRGLLLIAPGLGGGLEPPFSPDELVALENDETLSRAVADAWSKGDADLAFERLRQLWCSALEGPALTLFHRMVNDNRVEIFESRSERLAERSGPSAASRLGSIRVPVTLLVGDRDNPASGVFARRVARGLPGARLETVSGADHLLNLGRPDAFDAALDAALASTSGR